LVHYFPNSIKVLVEQAAIAVRIHVVKHLPCLFSAESDAQSFQDESKFFKVNLFALADIELPKRVRQ